MIHYRGPIEFSLFCVFDALASLNQVLSIFHLKKKNNQRYISKEYIYKIKQLIINFLVYELVNFRAVRYWVKILKLSVGLFIGIFFKFFDI